MTTAGDGDGCPAQDGRRLEVRLTKSGQAVVAGHAEVDRYDALADQSVCQVAGHIGLALAAVEVAAGGLDGQGQRTAQLAEPLPLERGETSPQRADGVGLAADLRAALAGHVARHPLVVTELGDDLERLVVPRPLLELKAQARQLLLEHPRALDIIRDHRSGCAIDEQQDGGRPAAQVLAHVAAGGEPRDRFGHAEDQGILARRVQEVADALMLQLDVGSPGAQGRIAVIGRGIGQGRQAVIVGTICRRVQDPIELHRQVERTRHRCTQSGEVSHGRHKFIPLMRTTTLASLGAWYRHGLLRVLKRRIGYPHRSMLF